MKHPTRLPLKVVAGACLALVGALMAFIVIIIPSTRQPHSISGALLFMLGLFLICLGAYWLCAGIDHPKP